MRTLLLGLAKSIYYMHMYWKTFLYFLTSYIYSKLMINMLLTLFCPSKLALIAFFMEVLVFGLLGVINAKSANYRLE